jgi:hypothetical protein
MLVLRKISTKKLAIYISIIILMTIGSGLMLYQNKKITQPEPVINQSQVIMPETEEIVANDQAGNDQIKPENTTPTEPVNTEKINDDGVFDLQIFSSEKYKSLKENVLIPRPPATKGKANPFKPN